jgi:hypothetical protein
VSERGPVPLNRRSHKRFALSFTRRCEHQVALEQDTGGRAKSFEFVRQPFAHTGELRGFEVGQEITERATFAPGKSLSEFSCKRVD